MFCALSSNFLGVKHTFCSWIIAANLMRGENGGQEQSEWLGSSIYLLYLGKLSKPTSRLKRWFSLDKGNQLPNMGLYIWVGELIILYPDFKPMGGYNLWYLSTYYTL